MKNSQVIEYIQKNVDPHVNQNGDEYIADRCVKEGFGQNCNGYLQKSKDVTEISQKEHFINFYSFRKEQSPSYAAIWCPQLMLFVAEIAGLSRDKLEDAYEYLKEFEQKASFCKQKKEATYMKGAEFEGKSVIKEFRRKLHIYEINTIIRQSQDWEEVISEMQKKGLSSK